MSITSTPFSREAQFELNELFFSITRRDSTIVSGNEVFVRISGYSKEELVGQPHNIIRHPDMPKSVFKLFWNYLNAGKAVIAYVKNRTKDGRHYWVVAAVFPQGDSYVSMRLKPTSPLFMTVQNLYKELKTLEEQSGVDAASTALEGALQELGYASYDAFMVDALLQELGSRNALLGSTQIATRDAFIIENSLDQRLLETYEVTQAMKKSYAVWFEKIGLFGEINAMLDTRGARLQALAQDMIFLSLNASVASYKAQSGGETFGVLAQNIRINVKENDALVEALHRTAGALTTLLNTLIFSAQAVYLQIEMVNFFIEEVLMRHCVDTHDVPQNIALLALLVESYRSAIEEAQGELVEQIGEALQVMRNLEQQVNYLGYVQIYGIIEAAAARDKSVGFEEIFSQLKTLIAATAQEVEAMYAQMQRFSVEIAQLVAQSDLTQRMAQRFGACVASIPSHHQEAA